MKANSLLMPCQFLQSDYTLGPQVKRDTYHIGVVRNPLTKNIDAIFPDLLDEIDCAVEDEIGSKTGQHGTNK
jgi:hypothetical protein